MPLYPTLAAWMLAGTAHAGQHPSLSALTEEAADLAAVQPQGLVVATSDPSLVTKLEGHSSLSDVSVSVRRLPGQDSLVQHLADGGARCGLWLEESPRGWRTRQVGQCVPRPAAAPAPPDPKDLRRRRRWGYVASVSGSVLGVAGTGFGIMAVAVERNTKNPDMPYAEPSLGAYAWLGSGLTLFLLGPSAGHHVVGAHWSGLGWTALNIGGILLPLALTGDVGWAAAGWGLVTTATLVDLHFAAGRAWTRRSGGSQLSLGVAPRIFRNAAGDPAVPGLSLSARW